MNNIEQLKGYTILSKQELKEVNGVGYILSHNKTKARVSLVLNDDNNKVFTIGFRTPPSDDTGVPHIMEHSVLCGSKNFPVKDPFVELCKGSLNTFLNAMTYSDKTVYPVASLNKKDFHNLLHVYMDAVFYPNIYSKEEIMMQEGWHYEVDEETGELKYNGVVYNEMKGAFSSAEQQLYRMIEKSVLPNTAYGFESGGDPVAIPKLTQEAFLDFHKKYYHPSNSYIYMYGDMDAEAELAFIDEEYLSNYEYLKVDSELTFEKPFEKPVHCKEYYSLADADDPKDNTFLTYNVSVGHATDKKLCMAISVLEYALLTAPGAPLKTALIDAGIGKDVYSSYDDCIMQPVFSIIAKNANEEDEARFISIINEELTKLIEGGIHKRSILAAINNFEFKHKEGNFGRFPKGLMLGLNAFTTWLYDDSAALDLFSMNDVFDELKQDLEKGYFEKLLKEIFLDNNHKSYAMLVPKKGLNAENEQKTADELAAYKATLSAEELETIKKKAEHLKKYQSEPSLAEDLEKIPMLTIDDIDKQARKIKNTFSEIENVKIISHDIFTNGISYVSLDFDVTDIELEKLPYVALLTEVFKDVDTANYSYNELTNEINLHTGGIGFSTIVSAKEAKGAYGVYFTIAAKMLDDKIDKGMEIIDEILFTSKIDDKKRLREIIAELATNIKMDLVASGHTTAAGRAMSYISELGQVKEWMEGIEYYKFVSDIDKNFEERYETLAENLKSVLGEILCRYHLNVSYTSDKDPVAMLTNSVTKLSKKLSTRLDFDRKEIKPIICNEGFKTASQVQYVATAGNYREKGLEYTGSLSVLQSIFSYDYLWTNVRVKGGAYGCMCAFPRSGNSYFTSYRDPNLMETMDVYKNAPEYVAKFEANDRDMLKYIIGAISKLDAPLTPSAEGTFSYALYLMGLTDEDLQRERDEILATDVEAIRALAPYVEAVVSNDIICAIGDEGKIESEAEHFGEVCSVF